MRQLHWFQNDLRLADNPALESAQCADSLLCIYLLPKPRAWCNLNGIGPQRDRFLRESLGELKAALQGMGQDLMVLEGSPELVLPNVVERYAIDRMTTSYAPGWYEAQAITFLEEKLPLSLEVFRGDTLFDAAQFPFELEHVQIPILSDRFLSAQATHSPNHRDATFSTSKKAQQPALPTGREFSKKLLPKSSSQDFS